MVRSATTEARLPLTALRRQSARAPRRSLDLIVRPASNGRFKIRSGSEGEVGVTAEEWVLAATVFLSGLAAGLFGMLSAIMRPMLAAMDGRDFRNFMETFLRYADHGLGKVYNLAWALVMGIGPIVALVLLWDDPGSTSFILTAIGLGIVLVGIWLVSNVWKTPTYNVILSWDPEAMPADWEAVRRRYFTINWIQLAVTWSAFALFLLALISL
jgi:hypothetical protein